MALADIRIQLVISEAGRVVEQLPEHRAMWGTGSLLPKRERVSVGAATFQALTVPSGAQSVYIDPGSAVSLVLKGVTGDTGIALTPATNPTGLPVLIPLGSSPSVGILNNHTSAQVVTVVWA